MPNIKFTRSIFYKWTGLALDPFPPSLLNYLATLLFLTVAQDRAPCAAASGRHYSTFCTMFGTYRHCTHAFVVKKTKTKNKKPCRSAKTKLTCDLWYQARSKAGMTGGGSKLALSNPTPHLKIQTQMYTITIHNATVCVHFVKKDTLMETSFVENWSKSCFLLATSTRFLASVLKKYP